MRLGLNLRYLGVRNGRPGHEDWPVLAREAEALGYAVVWAAEHTGSDAPSVLSWLAAHTSRIGLGSAVMQIPARTPAATAMTAATVDALSGGRFRLGLGVSGPQVSEGWHGVPFAHPLARTREYVAILRAALDGGEVTYQGEHFRLPLPGERGKALRLAMRPVRRSVPLYLASLGPRNLELAGELADGWLSVFFAPEAAAPQIDRLRAGRARAGLGLDGFDVVASVPLVIGDDMAACRDAVRAYTAHYLGGMGSRRHNFYRRVAERAGFGDAAAAVQEHYLAGRLRSAVAAVPDALLDRTALLGPVERVAERMRAYRDAGVTTLSVIVFTPDAAAGVRTLRGAAEALAGSGAGYSTGSSTARDTRGAHDAGDARDTSDARVGT